MAPSSRARRRPPAPSERKLAASSSPVIAAAVTPHIAFVMDGEGNGALDGKGRFDTVLETPVAIDSSPDVGCSPALAAEGTGAAFPSS